jgi:TrmH family RNA methyltransferase
MLPKKILSLQHPLVKHWVELRKERSYREECGRVLVSGEKVIRELPSPVEVLISVEPVQDLPAKEKFIATEEILKKITGLHQPDGYAAEVALPTPQDMNGLNFVLILDGIQDPGNLGTLLRTALGLGWEGVISTGETVDWFNDKALRAARGATFRLPYCRQTPEQIAAWLRGRPLWVGDAAGESVSSAAPQPPLALLLGSEGRGASDWARDLGRKLAIPMRGGVESLGVASAGAILLYALRSVS